MSEPEEVPAALASLDAEQMQALLDITADVRSLAVGHDEAVRLFIGALVNDRDAAERIAKRITG